MVLKAMTAAPAPARVEQLADSGVKPLLSDCLHLHAGAAFVSRANASHWGLGAPPTSVVGARERVKLLLTRGVPHKQAHVLPQ